MSIFNKVLHHFERRKPAAAFHSPDRIFSAHERDEFAESFRSMATRVAKPMLEQLAHDAKARGYAATVKEGVDEANNPYLGVTFIPERGAKLGGNAFQECIFQLKALLAEQCVEYTSCHDQRGGKKGLRVVKSDLQSINKTFLESEIEEFLTSSLEARERS